MRRLIQFTSLALFTNACELQALEVSGNAALNLAAHTAGAEPDLSEQGGQLVVKFTEDRDAFSLVGEGRARWNHAYANDYSEAARDDYEWSADWRELYIAKDVNQWNISLGMQQVVWGKADNLRVLDQVNPLDYRDFVLPDLNDYRKPLWMAKGEGYVGDWSVQTFYIPWFEPNDQATPGSEYEFIAIDPELLQSFTLLPEKKPAHTVDNGEAGVQIARSFSGLDINFSIFHTWDDNPVYRQQYAIDASGEFIAELQPEYHRQLHLGVAAAYSLANGFVLRTEWLVIPDSVYMLNVADINGGLIEETTVNALLGLDYSWRDWLFSMQANDRYIDNWTNEFASAEHQPLVTFSATGQSFSGRLESRIAIARFTDESNDQLLQIRTSWRPDDYWAYTLGADYFSGPAQGTFGQFAHKDRVWIKVQRYF
ncbi:DUF1302 family protein [Cellvibrio mixtus]|uniref:DUF1302 family protein n=1 Tax=Cellvibrio mixtus TaxID=39650 RepID=UPI000587E216|nr:DUF1302 family protein [Cellvibrio mixtus]